MDGSPRRAGDVREQQKEPAGDEILLSDGIHFPSRKVHLDVSVGGVGGWGVAYI